MAIFNVEGADTASSRRLVGGIRPPLEKGFVVEGVPFCPWHGVDFDIE